MRFIDRPSRFLLTACAACALAVFLAACGGNDDRPAPHDLQDSADGAVAQGLAGVETGRLTPHSTQLAVAGVGDIASHAAIVRGTLFSIGSNTKAMTAVVAARLIERGLLRWDTRVAEIFPDAPGATPSAFRDVTLEQLLAHRGGLPSFQIPSDFEAFSDHVTSYAGTLPGDETARRRFFADWLLRQSPPPGAVPGQTALYSNAGYALAGAMLEAVAGKSYETLFEEELAGPLGISGEWSTLQGSNADQPRSYIADADKHLTLAEQPTPDVEAWLDVLAPAGLFAATGASYATWLRWHLLALQGQATPLPAGYVQRLKDLATDDYAVGWVARQIDGRPVLWHNGATGGFQSDVLIDQAGAQASFVFTNTAADISPTQADGSWTMTLLDRTLSDIDRHGATAP